MRGAKQKEMFEIEISDLRRREILHLGSVCPYRMEDIFWVAKIQIFIWVLEIPDILLG